MTTRLRLSAATVAVLAGLAVSGTAVAACPGHQSVDSGTLQTAMNDTGSTVAKPAVPKDSGRK